jgi:hypothetical protein
MIEGRLISSSTHRSAFFRLAELYPGAHQERVPAPEGKERVEFHKGEVFQSNISQSTDYVAPLIRHAALKQSAESSTGFCAFAS